jgi:hypothetical protein
MVKVSDHAPAQPDDVAGLSSVTRLLRLLHAQDASAERQKAVIRAWLVDNTPSPPLRFSLRSNGYGLLVDETDDLKGVKRPRLGSKPITATYRAG